MIYTEWMRYIKDDVKLTSLVIPGAHNAGSYGMNKTAECQSDNLLVQFEHGIRQFCLRLDTKRNGDIVLAHGISKGDLFENALKDIQKIIANYPTEFLLLDIREYYPQKFGPITLKYRADKDRVNELLKKHLNPEKNAYYTFDKINEVTVGDIRNAGKKFILINNEENYKFSKSCQQILPWEKAVNGARAEKFAKETLRFFDDYKTDGLYWFQTQQTPNPGTEIGLKSPKTLDDELIKYFGAIIDGIAATPRYLQQANIIAGDFMTRNYNKSRAILRLNLLKNNVKPEMEAEYDRLLKEN